MIKVYLKQAWELLKQNKLFSMLYIVGTGLAIAMTMVMAMWSITSRLLPSIRR